MVQNEPEIWFIWLFVMFLFFLHLVSAIFLYKSQFWEKSGSCYMSGNALSQSDCRIFKSTISPERNDEMALFFVCPVLNRS